MPSIICKTFLHGIENGIKYPCFSWLGYVYYKLHHWPRPGNQPKESVLYALGDYGSPKGQMKNFFFW